MKIHETPKEVASTLARWAPRRISCLLDPSVGTGSLLAPLVPRLRDTKSLIYCVDIDKDALQIVKRRFGCNLGPSLALVRKNFLELDFTKHLKKHGHFDCVVMNPPFAGRPSDRDRQKARQHPSSSSCSAFGRIARGTSIFRTDFQ